MPSEVAERAASSALEEAGVLIQGLTKSERKRVQKIISDAAYYGWTPTKTATRIQQVVGLTERDQRAVDNLRASLKKVGRTDRQADAAAQKYATRLRKARSRTIADYEVRKQMGDAQRQEWAQDQHDGRLSPYAVRIFKTHKDERRCPVCKSLNGRRTSLRSNRPAPPMHPNCRCYEVLEDQGVVKGDTRPDGKVLKAAVVAKVRRVRTPEGSRRYGLPIGAPIPPGARQVSAGRLADRKRQQHLRDLPRLDDDALSDGIDFTPEEGMEVLTEDGPATITAVLASNDGNRFAMRLRRSNGSNVVVRAETRERVQSGRWSGPLPSSPSRSPRPAPVPAAPDADSGPEPVEVLAEKGKIKVVVYDQGGYGKSAPTLDMEARAAVEEMFTFTDPGSGLHTQIVNTRVQGRYSQNPYVVVSGDIRDSDEEFVGHFTRSLDLVEGEVDHELFKINPEYQGQGFMQNWFMHVAQHYVDNEFETITVHANIDVGGYTWARKGFEWNDPPDKVWVVFDGVLRDAQANPSLYPTWLVEQISDMVTRWEAGEPPMAWEVAELGRREWLDGDRWELPEQDTYDQHPLDWLDHVTEEDRRDGSSYTGSTWARGFHFGKALLLGSDWYGSMPVKALAQKASRPRGLDLFRLHTQWVNEMLTQRQIEVPPAPEGSDINEHFLDVVADEYMEERLDDIIAGRVVKARRVRTPAGSRFYGLPIGAPIPPGGRKVRTLLDAPGDSDPIKPRKPTPPTKATNDEIEEASKPMARWLDRDVDVNESGLQMLGAIDVSVDERARTKANVNRQVRDRLREDVRAVKNLELTPFVYITDTMPSFQTKFVVNAVEAGTNDEAIMGDSNWIDAQHELIALRRNLAGVDKGKSADIQFRWAQARAKERAAKMREREPLLNNFLDAIEPHVPEGEEFPEEYMALSPEEKLERSLAAEALHLAYQDMLEQLDKLQGLADVHSSREYFGGYVNEVDYYRDKFLAALHKHRHLATLKDVGTDDWFILQNVFGAKHFDGMPGDVPMVDEDIDFDAMTPSELVREVKIAVFVRDAIDTWATTSNDNHPRAIALQMAADEYIDVTLGMRTAGLGWIKNRDSKKQARDRLGHMRAAYRGFVHAVYTETQEYLNEQGIDEVVVYRGISIDMGDEPDWLMPLWRRVRDAQKNTADRLDGEYDPDDGTPVAGSYNVRSEPVADMDIQMGPLSSWSSSPAMAETFALDYTSGEWAIVARVTVPAERIWSLASTGPGALHEAEYILFGGEAVTDLEVTSRINSAMYSNNLNQ